MSDIAEYAYKPAIGWDTETHPITMGCVAPPIVCLSRSFKDQDAFQSDLQVIAERGSLSLSCVETVTEADFQMVAHNTAFDLGILATFKPELMPLIFLGLEKGIFEDTIIREKLLHLSTHGDPDMWNLPDGGSIRLNYGLNDLTKRYLGKDRADDKNSTDSWRTNYNVLEKLPLAEWPADAIKYVIEDSEDALAIRECQEVERIKVWRAIGHDPFRTEPFHVACSFALFLMTTWGFPVDAEAKAKIEAQLLIDLKPERMQKLVTSGILRPGTPSEPYKNGAMNSDGTPKMKAPVEESINKKVLVSFMTAWAQEHKVDLKLNPPTEKALEKDPNAQGSVSTQLDFFEEHKVDHPVFEEYYNRQRFQKLVTTELPRMTWQGKTALRVHPCFDVVKKTGRTSSYASKLYPSFNAQNVDPRVRNCFIPDEGYVMFSIDYSGMELGTLGQKLFNLFGRSVHKDKINAGIDNHTYLGSQLAYSLDAKFKQACDESGAKTPDEVYAAFAGLKKSTDESVKKFFKHYRTFAKPTGLGYPGGLGAKTFITYAKTTYGIVVDLEMAKNLKSIWLDTYPEMREYFKWISDCCVDPFNPEKHAYLSPFGMYRAGADFCAAANGAALQTFSAEGAKLAVFNVQRACYDPSVGSILYGKMRPMAFIHDEILGEVPEDGTETELCNEAARIMVEAMAVVTPDVKPSCSPVLMRRWSKEAEPVINSEGKLIPWEPKA